MQNGQKRIPISDNPVSLGLKPGEMISFQKGMPVFTPWKVGKTYKVPGVTGNRGDFGLIYEVIARDKGWFYKGNPNKSKAQKWLSENELVPHHAGGLDVELIPGPLHGLTGKYNGVRHQGGAYGLRNE